MTNKLSFVTANELYRDSYASSQSQERALNAAIVQPEIGEGYEQFLENFDAFYADDVEVSSESQEEPIRGKAAARSILTSFLFPLHVMAEVGGAARLDSPHRDPCRRHCRDALRLDGRPRRGVRNDLHSELARLPEMARVARSVRASLRRAANRRATHLE